MLQSLHVKNLALIEETEVNFNEGLNILTGETGAGKSLLLGSVNLALGGRFDKDMLRKGADSGLVELIFSVKEDSGREKLAQKLQELDLECEADGTVIITRKLSASKSVSKINGETVTAKQIREVAEILIDIHGQHEHQSLLNKKKHLEILDDFCGKEYEIPANEVKLLFNEVNELREKIKNESMDDEKKNKEQSFAEFELKEIDDANLKPGEDEILENRYRMMVNGKKITENLSESHMYTGNDGMNGAGEAISRALKNLRNISMLDEKLSEFETQLVEIDNLLADYNRDVAQYMSDIEFSESDYNETMERLNLINRLKDKYGNSIEDILDYRDSREEYLNRIADYDNYMSELKKQLHESESRLSEACKTLSDLRIKNADILTGRLKTALEGLNFTTVEFKVNVTPGQNITSKGYDDVEFMISTNPGMSMGPLGQVASGGELSRVMLAIKTVMAGRDEIDALIFDEIDAGISGKTAWKVSEQLHLVAKEHQVICITHLPQIAAMADSHFVIEKNSTDDSTITNIYRVEEDGQVAELARLLGSDTLTEAATINAREMLNKADEYKLNLI